MKKYFSNIRTLAALLMAGAAFAACSNSDNEIEEQPVSPAKPQVYTLTVYASKGTAETRALSLDDTKLLASWENGDELTVYNSTKGAALGGTLTASNASGATATFSGTLTGTIAEGDELILSYHQPTGFSAYGAQTGTLASAAGRDYATAIVEVASVTSGKITTTEAAFFTTQTAVLKLTLQDNADTPTKLKATQLNISAAMTITINSTPVPLAEDIVTFDLSTNTYSDGDGVLYFALPPKAVVAEYVTNRIKNDNDYSAYASLITTEAVETALSGATLTYTATVNSDTYTATKTTGYNFAAAKYYAGTLTMTKQTTTLSDATLADAFKDDNITVIEFGNLLKLSATYNGSSFVDVTKSGDMANYVSSPSMAKDGNNLVISITVMGVGSGSMTIDTVNNTYSWSNATVGAMITLTGITIGGNSITPLPTVQ